MHRLAVSVVAVAVACCTFAAAGGDQAADSGSISGRVRLTTKMRGTALPSTMYSPRAVGRQETAPVPEIRNVVVYVKDAPVRGPLQVSKAELQQHHEAFIPRVLAVTKGSTVEFPNADPFFHNVFSLSRAATFDLGRYPQGGTRQQTFPRPGLVKVFCKIHSHMSASILVLDHPYFTTPNTDGTFVLPNVPAGQFTIVGWHERVGERAEPIRIQAGRTATVELTVPVEDVR